MSDQEDSYRELIVVHVVDYTVLADADAPTVTVLELTTSWWTRFFGEMVYGPRYALAGIVRQPLDGFTSLPL